MIGNLWQRRAVAVAVVGFAIGVALTAAPTTSPVADAARDADVERVRELLRGGADVNASHLSLIHI